MTGVSVQPGGTYCVALTLALAHKTMIDSAKPKSKFLIFILTSPLTARCGQ